MKLKQLKICYQYYPTPISFANYNYISNCTYFVRQWYKCRDLWQTRMGKPDVFFLAHESGKSKNIIEFMKVVENKLNLKEKSCYGFTQKKFIIYIKPSKWWLQKAIKKSLYTLLLRCGSNYIPSKNNFCDALQSEKYLFDTKNALNRFLSGHTNYHGKIRGWYNQFFLKKPNELELNRLLTK